MSRKEIHFVIDQAGTIQSSIKGIKGSTCSFIADKIKDLGQVIEKQQTNEFYETCNSSKLSLDLTRNE